jgi:hypothetical protein
MGRQVPKNPPSRHGRHGRSRRQGNVAPHRDRMWHDMLRRIREGTKVKLTEKPVGTTFEGWGGACSGTGTCEVTMSEPITVEAKFKEVVLAEFPVEATVTGEGEVIGSEAAVAIKCKASSGTCSEEIEEGAKATLEANADAGWKFDG